MKSLKSTIKNKKTAFTLAEVLITLAIIGVVAALSIPALIQNTQNQQYVTRLQKFYSTMNQTLTHIANDYGCAGDLVCTGIFDNGGVEDVTAYANAGDVISKYFKVAKNCGVDTTSDCWAPGIYNNIDGTGLWGDYNTLNYYKFNTIDGMNIMLSSKGTNCQTNWGNTSNSPTYKVCGNFWVDINGQKGPNARGRDLFEFMITSNKAPMLYPRGGSEDNTNGTPCYWNYNNNNTCSSTSKSGMRCAGRIMEKGWVMDY